MSAYSAAILATSGLVSYWRLNETGGASATDSKGSNTGTYAGGFELNKPGPFSSDPTNRSVAFNGTTGKITVAASASLRPANVTVEAWVFPVALVAQSGIVSSNHFTTKVGYELGLGPHEVGSKKLEFSSFNGTWHSAPETTELPLNKWQYVVGEFTGSKLLLFRNAEQVAEATFAGPLEYNAETFTIAVDHTEAKFFNGRISEVAIYSSALSQSKMLEHFQIASEGAIPSLGYHPGLMAPGSMGTL